MIPNEKDNSLRELCWYCGHMKGNHEASRNESGLPILGSCSAGGCDCFSFQPMLKPAQKTQSKRLAEE